MKYQDLDSVQKQHVNGVISRFMDNYVRNNLVWTPEQMYEDFYKEIDKQHKNGEYGGKQMIDGEWISPYYVGNSWLTTVESKDYIIKKFKIKWNKNNKLAKKDSPLIERLRFGTEKGPDPFYDISWGLKNGYEFVKTDVVERNDLIPWSIAHVEYELGIKYGKNIPTVLEELSGSPIEKMFYNKWISMYYNNTGNPALIPEICGSRKKYTCYKDTRGKYHRKSIAGTLTVNVRYDFAVINYTKKKKLILELDGHDYHKTKEQRINDSVKRSIVTEDGWLMDVITGTQIHRDLDGVFESLKDFLSYE